jgi:hypothetical protein
VNLHRVFPETGFEIVAPSPVRKELDGKMTLPGTLVKKIGKRQLWATLAMPTCLSSHKRNAIRIRGSQPLSSRPQSGWRTVALAANQRLG